MPPQNKRMQLPRTGHTSEHKCISVTCQQLCRVKWPTVGEQQSAYISSIDRLVSHEIARQHTVNTHRVTTVQTL